MRKLLADIYCARQKWDTRRIFNGLMVNQHRPRAELTELQQGYLSETLGYCATQVPYYRDLGCTGNIDSYPVLTKELIAKHNEQLVAPQADRAGSVVGQGSGTTGRQARILVDRRHLEWSQACWWRMDRFFELPDHPRTVNISNKLDKLTLSTQFKRYIASAMLNRFTFYSTLQSDDGIRSLNGWLHRYRPQILSGILSPIMMYMHRARRLGLKPPRLRLLRPYGETLTGEYRQELEEWFSAPVAMRYGTREVGSVSMECEHGNYHQSIENVFLEVLKDDGSISTTGSGRLLITNLQNRLMPLVRYDVGDVVTLADGECPCGRTLPLMGEILGRSYEFITRPDGVEVAGFAFHKALCRLNVSDYRVTQDSADHLDVQVVPTEHWGSEDEKAWEARRDYLIEGKMQVDFRKVDSIPLAPSGKRIQMVNLLREDSPVLREFSGA